MPGVGETDLCALTSCWMRLEIFLAMLLLTPILHHLSPHQAAEKKIYRCLKSIIQVYIPIKIYYEEKILLRRDMLKYKHHSNIYTSDTDITDNPVHFYYSYHRVSHNLGGLRLSSGLQIKGKVTKIHSLFCISFASSFAVLIV